jgi:hypothetical protein
MTKASSDSRLSLASFAPLADIAKGGDGATCPPYCGRMGRRRKVCLA